MLECFFILCSYILYVCNFIQECHVLRRWLLILSYSSSIYYYFLIKKKGSSAITHLRGTMNSCLDSFHIITGLILKKHPGTLGKQQCTKCHKVKNSLKVPLQAIELWNWLSLSLRQHLLLFETLQELSLDVH